MDQLQPNSPQASPSKFPANSSTFSHEEVFSLSDKTCQTTLSIPCSSEGNSQNKMNKSSLLKYITCTKSNTDSPIPVEYYNIIFEFPKQFSENRKFLRIKILD